MLATHQSRKHMKYKKAENIDGVFCRVMSRVLLHSLTLKGLCLFVSTVFNFLPLSVLSSVSTGSMLHRTTVFCVVFAIHNIEIVCLP